jgi:membrane-associated phospholipid phosphatase
MCGNTKAKCLFGLVVFAGLLSTARPSFAQTPSSSPSPAPPPSTSHPLESHFFKNILEDQKAIWRAPFHLREKDARWLVPLGLGTAALIATDRRTGDAIADSTDQLKPSRIISYAGSVYAVGGAAAAFYIVGRSQHNERARETGVLAAETLVDSGIVVNAVKAATRRRRPMQLKHSDFFDGGTSFPSGHAIQIWSLATIVASEYHDRKAVQIAAYGIASAVSVARFTARKHYLSDSLIGSALGYGIGRYVYCARHQKGAKAGITEEESLVNSSWPLIAPQYDRRAHEYGVTLAWSF